MSSCDAIFAQGSAGLVPTLGAVDCLTAELTTTAFGRLFGSEGALMPALTILLTLYIAFFALSLLTGRTLLGVSSLTPRMLTLGLVLTFSTSWVAYQQVIWNLTVGGPDWIATVISGAHGSATQIFAQRIDIVFDAIQETSTAVQGSETSGPTGVASPGTMMWLAGLMFMLGTVGLLVTAKIALAVLLMLGPVFIILAIFPATRGLFVGWLKASCIAALTPMIAVIAGSFMLKLIVPVIRGLAEGADPAGVSGAVPLFMLSAVHMALMYVVLNLAMTMVSGWTVFGLAPAKIPDNGNSPHGSRPPADPTGMAEARAADVSARTERSAAAPASAAIARAIGQFSPQPAASATAVVEVSRHIVESPAAHSHSQGRACGIGSRFRTPPRQGQSKLAGAKP